MTRKEQLECLTDRPCAVCKYHGENGCSKWSCVFEQEPDDKEPCEDAVSREALKKMLIGLDKWHVKNKQFVNVGLLYDDVFFGIEQLPSVTQKSGKCKNCKYFEYDSVAKVDGMPLIVAHEICNKWGNGCKTKEDGYCYLFEPQERSE